MKTYLIWFCGTGTPKEDMEPIFEGQNYDKKIIVSGVGTDQTSENVRKLQNSYFFNPLSLFSTKRDIVLGYREKHQLSSAQEGMLQIYTELSNVAENKSVHLIIGGHSRGAADGMFGLLSSLCASCTIPNSYPQENLLFRKLSKISLIAVDPVNGAELKDSKIGRLFDTNDLMGFNDLPEGQQRISYLLNTIEERSNRPGLFNVVLYAARFDARNEFLFDKHWFKFLNETQNGIGFTGDFKYYVGGFRHSAMVYESSEITGLYESDNTPISLLRHILMDVKVHVNSLSAELVYRNMAAREIMLINNLIFEENPVLEGQTNTQSYSWPEMITSYGEALKDVAFKYKDDGNPIINNRYLKQYRN